MNILIKTGRQIYGCYFYFVFAVVFLILFPLFWVLLLRESNYHLANRLRKFWAATVFWLTRYSVHVDFETPFEKGCPYVFCSNHSSLLDICTFALIFDVNYRYMAKAAYAKIPLFGIFFKTIDIAVNRESKIGAYEAWKQAGESIDNGFSMIIFPEGTTSPLDGSLRRFKNGPFKLAIEKQVPIVPITYINNWELFHYDRGFYAVPGKIKVVVHRVIETRGLDYSDLIDLRERVFLKINAPLTSTYESRQAIG